jgi:diaminopropionate ammonia-lyase
MTQTIDPGGVTLALNPHAGQKPEPADLAALGPDGAREVFELLRQCPRYAPTPLVRMPDLAARIGVAELMVKDEAARLGLGSFKALGGAFAVIRLALSRAGERLGRDPAALDPMDPQVRAGFADLVVCCATDGNHGRSVAAAARLLGLQAVIFVHENVAPERVAAIAALGAQIKRTPGSYDDAVQASLTAATAEGWLLVSDTSWPGYEAIPMLVMQGYAALVAEAARQWDAPPTHVFLQAGVGGLAASVATHIAGLDLPQPLAIVVVEPARAACLLASQHAGRPLQIEADEPTNMALLECYEPSHLAWRQLHRAAAAFLAVPDEAAEQAAALWMRPPGADPALRTTPSGAAGLAGLLAVAADSGRGQALGLGPESRVLLINTEGSPPAPAAASRSNTQET